MGAEELIERLSRASERISMQMRSASIQDWPDIELTMPQLRTLVLLSHGPQRMGEIAAALGISLPATTNMIVRLEGKGLVERVHDRDDRRVVRCHLRDPSWFQWPLLEVVIEGNIVADFPLCNKSFNCSYSGHDL